MYCMSTNLRVPRKEVKEFLCLKAPLNFPLPPLDSVVWYRVYTFFEGGIEMDMLSIGQVARRAGVGVETGRCYEREGLLQEPPRRASGYRRCSKEVVTRLRFIKRPQQFGFPLQDPCPLP